MMTSNGKEGSDLKSPKDKNNISNVIDDTDGSIEGVNSQEVNEETGDNEFSEDGDDALSVDEQNEAKNTANDEDDEGTESRAKLAQCLPALRRYLMDRLTFIQAALVANAYINPYSIRNGHAVNASFSESTWRVDVVRRSGGLTTGLLDFTYIHTGRDGRKIKHRGRAEVFTYVGLLPPFKTIKNMTKDHCFLNAEENRERHVLSQLLSLHGYICDEIKFNNGDISIVKGADTFTNYCVEPVSTFWDTTPRENTHFTYGNTVILQWGTVVKDNPLYHSANQIFPLGFRCIRMEHDVSLDRVVDCLCEIDGVYEHAEEGETSGFAYYSALSACANEAVRAKLTTHNLIPLFRITVSWQIGSEMKCVTRVYEARSPQQAWQAAMLETLGLPNKSKSSSANRSAIPGSESRKEEDMVDSDGDVDDGIFEEPDDEELQLRAQIRDQRRNYFRALRAEQSLGLQAAVKPRLALDVVDTFAEDMIMRFIEGLPSTSKCENFIFTDLRDPLQAGRKNMMKSYTKAYLKAKVLDKRIKKCSQFGDSRDDGVSVDVDSDAESNILIHIQRVRMNRIKDIEKNIGLLRITLAKTVKKRRDDAKLYVESICDHEEPAMLALTASLECRQSTALSLQSPSEYDSLFQAAKSKLASQFNGNRPLPTAGSLVLCGNTVGCMLEIWEYLHIFAKPLKFNGLSSMEKLLGAVKVCDPIFNAVTQYCRGIENTKDFIQVMAQLCDVNSILPTLEEANETLNEIGMMICSVLMKDFEKLMGIEAMESQLSSLKIPLNELTWKEIARVILLDAAAKSIGISDADVASMVKGKGYTAVPDSADRKTLKLARRRILFSYTLRNENQESLYGFESGICIRIPAPGNPLPSPRKLASLWISLLDLQSRMENNNSWLKIEIMKLAVVTVCLPARTTASRQVQQSLVDCLKGIDVSSTADLNARVQTVLQAVSSSALPVINETVTDLFDNSGIPHSVFNLWSKQVREAQRYAHVDESQLNIDQMPHQMKFSQGDDAVQASDVNPGEIWPEVEQEKMLVVNDSGVSAAAVTQTSAPEGNMREELVIDSDAADAEKLTIAMQRCYIVIRDLMNNVFAGVFIFPVNSSLVASYYKFVKSPLSLIEIRKFLVSGGYENSIYRFYMDIRFLLENAICFNPEGSVIKSNAQKVMIIFERMFIETVLAWDNPLAFSECCVTCRLMYQPKSNADPSLTNKMVVCDRCEASYHLDCLHPPMSTPPRDWFCLPCVEQIGLASVHPFKTAHVVHPDDPSRVGEVVGIEQPKQTLMFVVAFGGHREMWNGKKIRQYAFKAEVFTSNSSSGNSNERETKKEHEYNLPSGYDMDDYDRVCGFARGYCGWGESHYLVPSILMSAHSVFAAKASKSGSAFVNNRLGVAALAASGKSISPDCCNSMHEWATILHSLQQRSLTAPAIANIITQSEEGVSESTVSQLLDEIHVGKLSQNMLTGIIHWHRDHSTHVNITNKKEDNLKFSIRTKSDYHVASSPKLAPASKALQITAEDSDNDSDFEMFDSEGNCLTSFIATAPVLQKAPVVTAVGVQNDYEEDWELRFLSRQKGREDALFTQVLLSDMLAQVELYSQKEREYSNFNTIRDEVDVDFYEVAMQVLSKLCMAKPSDALLPDDWCRCWENQMNSINKQIDHNKCPEDATTCGFCSMGESYLLSPFVKGQTLEEWLLDALNETEQHQCSSTGIDSHVNLTQATVTSSTGIKGFRATKKLMKGVTFEPLDDVEADLEREECKKARHRTLRSGSLIMHECCANYMHVYRQIAYERAKQAEECFIAEILLGLRRAKSTPIGRDRDNSFYWIFSGLKYLVVSSCYGQSTETKDAVLEMPSVLWNTEDCKEITNDEVNRKWYVYRTAEEIGMVMLWLRRETPCERLLRRILHLLFPEAETLAAKQLNKTTEKKVEITEDSDSEMDLSDDEPAVADEEAEVGIKAEVCGDSKNSKFAAEEEEFDEDGVDNDFNTSQQKRRRIVDDDDEDDELQLTESTKRVKIESELNADKSSAVVLGKRIRKPTQFDDSYKKTEPPKAPCKQGDSVLVKGQSSGILWEARVMKAKELVGLDGKHLYYKVRFAGWGRSYDGWFSSSLVVTSTSSHGSTRASKTDMEAIKHSRDRYLQSRVMEAPDTLKTLSAFKFSTEPHRHCGFFAPILTYCNARTTVGMLRAALLLVEAALPLGSVDDESDDKWGDNFVEAWREAVVAAHDAASLMQCQIMLECAVRNAWLRPAASKLLTCLASRAHAMRNATCGAVAIRLWVLDSGIRYDKVQLEQEPEGGSGTKGRSKSGGRQPKASKAASLSAATASEVAAATMAVDEERVEAEIGNTAINTTINTTNTTGSGRPLRAAIGRKKDRKDDM